MQLINGNKTLQESLNLRNPNIWNHWKINLNPRKENRIQIIGFTFLETHKIDHYNFDKVQFNDCSFEKVTCKNSSFQNSTFESECRFEGGFDNNIKMLVYADFRFCNFRNATFENAFFKNANLDNCYFTDSKFLNTKIFDTDFFGSNLIFTKFHNSHLKHCKIFGTNVWEVDIQNTKQEELIIKNYRNSVHNEEENNQLIVYDIEVAHLINLLTNNKKFTNVFNASKSTYVLILGRFENIDRLEELKKAVEQRSDLSPILFDWEEKTKSLNLVETILLLASLSKFIIVDLSNPKSAPAELQAILSNLMIPVIPILQSSEKEPYALFSFTNNLSWVKEVIIYDHIKQIIEKFETAIINPAKKIAEEIEHIKSLSPKKKHINDFE